MARSKEPTIADLFEELEIIIEEFENNYEQTLKELKKKLKERQTWLERKPADVKPPSRTR